MKFNWSICVSIFLILNLAVVEAQERNKVVLEIKDATEKVEENTDVSKYQNLVDLLELLIWPFTIILIITVFRKQLQNLIGKTDSIKVGSFEINLKKIAQSSGIPNISEHFQGLNYEELRYFFIICGDSSDRYFFKDTGKNASEQRAIYQSLMERSLLTFTEEYDEQKGVLFPFKTTTIGEKAHKALLDTVYSEIIQLK